MNIVSIIVQDVEQCFGGFIGICAGLRQVEAALIGATKKFKSTGAIIRRIQQGSVTQQTLIDFYLPIRPYDGLSARGRVLEKHHSANRVKTIDTIGVDLTGVKKCFSGDGGSPFLLVRRTLHFKQKESAIYTELFCRTDRFEFYQDLGGFFYG